MKVEHPTQILYVKPFSPGSYYYPKPDYIGSIDYIELDKEIGKYHINNIKNGLAPSFTIHFKNGVPASEERRKIRNDIERQLAGATNAGKFIVTYSDSPDRKPDFEPFPLSDADKQYQFLSTEVSDKIMVGHRVVSSAMFGVKTAGQLGNTQELEIASELFDRQVIKPYQRIVEDAVQQILSAAGTSSLVTVQEVPAIQIQAKEEYDLNLVDFCQRAELWPSRRKQAGQRTHQGPLRLYAQGQRHAPTREPRVLPTHGGRWQLCVEERRHRSSVRSQPRVGS
jgi:hypothetical protein